MGMCGRTIFRPRRDQVNSLILEKLKNLDHNNKSNLNLVNSNNIQNFEPSYNICPTDFLI